jgi:large subunit ribosomal protein L5
MADEDKKVEAPAAPKKEKASKRKKEEVKKAGFAANIEEGLQVQPARLKLRYRKEVVPQLMKELACKNPMEVPRINKIVVNMGLGEALAKIGRAHV